MSIAPGRAAPPLLLIAGSGLAREVCAAAEAGGRVVIGCVDDDARRHGTELAPGVPILGGLDRLADYPDAELVVCAGKGSTRAVLVDRLLAERDGPVLPRFGTVIDPSVAVPPSCSVGEGTVLLAGTVLTAAVTIGHHVVCMPNVVLTHDDVVEDYATLCAGVVLGGSVTVGRAAYVGMAASVRENVWIGSGVTIGMGAVVLTDALAGRTYAGVPARELPSPPP